MRVSTMSAMSPHSAVAVLALLAVACAASAADAAMTKGPGPGRQYGKGGRIEKCPPGTAKSGPGAFKCRKCAGKNAYQDLAGQTRCKQCPPGPGHVISDDRIRCTYYAPGMTTSKSGKPTKCAKGFAKDGAGPFRCTACKGTTKAGGQRYSDTLGATACKVCPGGGAVNSKRTTCTPPTPAPTVPTNSCGIPRFPGEFCADCPSECVVGTTCSSISLMCEVDNPDPCPLPMSVGDDCSSCPCDTLLTCEPSSNVCVPPPP